MAEELPELSHRAALRAASKHYRVVATAVVLVPTLLTVVLPGLVGWIAKGANESAFDAATGDLFVASLVAAAFVLVVMLIGVSSGAHWAYAKKVVSAHKDRIARIEAENNQLRTNPPVIVQPGATYNEIHYHQGSVGAGDPRLWLPRGVEITTTDVQIIPPPPAGEEG